MKNQVKTLLLLAAALCVVILYAVSKKDISFDFSLRKASLSKLTQPRPADSLSAAGFDASAEARREAERVADSIRRSHPDTTHQRVLFFGDSMLEGLSRRFSDYAEQNGHDLHTVLWYSSTSKLWAETDTLQHFMNEVKPTYIVVCLCSNELFVNDMEKRDKYVKTVLSKIGKTPYVWISPPNWKDDTGINDVIIRNVGMDRYFDSRHLELKRGRDHAHPTFAAAEIWMDSVATWLRSSKTLNPIRMDKPLQKAKKNNLTILMPYGD